MKKLILSLSILSASAQTQAANLSLTAASVPQIMGLAKQLHQVSSDDSFVLPMRGSKEEVQGMLVHDRTFEFPNGNTFVMLNPGKAGDLFPLAYHTVTIPIPGHLTSSAAMELLFKVYAARMALASEVVVQGPVAADAVSLPFNLALRPLLATAGASSYCSGDHCEDLASARPKLRKPNGSCRSGVLIVGDSHVVLRDAIAEHLGEPGYGVGELLQSPERLRGRTTYLVSSPQSNDANTSFLQTLAAAQDLLAAGACQVHLISPYLPYARSDKPEWEYGVATQGRLVAELLSYAGFHAISVVRPHALQAMGFFAIPAFALSGRQAVTDYLATKGIELVVSPDAGFQKDATHYAEELNVGVAVINKQRSVQGDASIVSGSGLDQVAGRVVAVIDDETASGGTLAMSAKLLKDLGAKKVYAVVTHLAGPAEAILGNPVVDEMVATDTLPSDAAHSKTLTRLSVAAEIAEHIRGLSH